MVTSNRNGSVWSFFANCGTSILRAKVSGTSRRRRKEKEKKKKVNCHLFSPKECTRAGLVLRRPGIASATASHAPLDLQLTFDRRWRGGGRDPSTIQQQATTSARLHEGRDEPSTQLTAVRAWADETIKRISHDDVNVVGKKKSKISSIKHG